MNYFLAENEIYKSSVYLPGESFGELNNVVHIRLTRRDLNKRFLLSLGQTVRNEFMVRLVHIRIEGHPWCVEIDEHH